MVRITATDDLMKLMVMTCRTGGWEEFERRWNFTLIKGRYAKDAPLVGFEWITPPELEFESASAVTAFLLQLRHTGIIY